MQASTPELSPLKNNGAALPSTPRLEWIANRRFDLCFFFASGIFSLALGAVVLAAPSSLFPLWLAWLCCIEGPHVYATWQRTYFDTDVRRAQRPLLRHSLLWFLPAPMILAMSYLSAQPWLFELLLGFAALWSFHHLVRQHHGILALYQRLNRTSSSARWQDKTLLHACFWLSFLLFLSANSSNRQILQLPEISTLLAHLHTMLAALIVGLILLWLGLLLQRYRNHASLKPGVFALFIATGTSLFALFVIGPHEPLLAKPRSAEQVFMAVTMVNGCLHGLQYLGIVIASSRRRMQIRVQLQGIAASNFAQRLGNTPWLAYAFFLLLSIPYVGLNLLRGGAPLGPAPSSLSAQIFLALYWGLFFHHYWLDQHIWKPSKDPQLRAELGLA